VNECLDSTWISSIGSFIDRFEAQFATFCGTAHGVSCANGTVALHVALRGFGIGPGDEVVVPALTYVATANAVRYCGAEPVFVDSDRATWNLDPNDLARKITPRTRAIIAVHLYGRPAPMREVLQAARAHGLLVLEDAAEAHGARYYGQPVGSLGNAAAFSFFGNKIITSGEGGMVVTQDAALAARVRQLKGQGQDPMQRYWFPIVGYNYRMTNIEAAIGLAQLEQVDDAMAARDAIATWYRAALDGVPGVILPEQAPHERSVCWLFSVVLEHCTREDRDRVMARMRDAGVDTRPFFYPVDHLPPYQSAATAAASTAAWLSARGLSLPTWVGMTRQHVDRVCEALVAAVSLAGTRGAVRG
jgi:perosamine synthetase